jgi:hypothetical protein
VGKDIKQPTVMERMFYLIMKEPEFTEASFTYTLDGNSEAVVLSEMDNFSLGLTRDQVGELEFSDIEGDVDVNTTYIGTPQDMVLTDDIQIQRYYSVDGEPVTTSNVHQGDIIEVEFVITVTDDIWNVSIEDVLPAGLVYYTSVYGDDYNYTTVNDKEISMVVYRSLESNVMTVSYKAIATSVGTYTADYLVIQNLYGVGGQYVEQESLVINP